MLTGEMIWDVWVKTGQAAKFRVTPFARGGNVRDHLLAIKTLVQTEDELEQAMRLWWASPAVPLDKRNLGIFTSQLTGVLHHLDMGFTHPFGTTPPARLGIRGSKTQDNAASVAAAIANFQVRES
jgi:hypothetical protein